jgi:hypothetical protein
MNNNALPLEYLHEESVRTLIKLLIESHFSSSPSKALPEKVFRTLQELVDSEGAYEWQSDHIKILRPKMQILVTQAKDYKKRHRQTSLGTDEHTWLFNENLRTPNEIQETKILLSLIARAKKIELADVISDFLTYHHDDYIQQIKADDKSTFAHDSYPASMASHILSKFDFNSIHLHKKQLKTPKLSSEEEWRRMFVYLFKHVFPISDQVFNQVWGIIEPNLKEIRFSIADRTYEMLNEPNTDGSKA